jgi:hypothetical protein
MFLRETRIDVQFQTGLATQTTPSAKAGSHLVRVTLPQALADLKPVAAMTMENDEKAKPLEFAAPSYSIQIAPPPVPRRIELWLHLPDGRRAGPLRETLDFQSGPMKFAREEDARAAERREPQWAVVRLQGQINSYLQQVKNHQANQARFAELNNAYKRDVAEKYVQALNERLRREYPGWRTRCTAKTDSPPNVWECIGRRPPLSEEQHPDEVIHEIVVGPEPDDLHIQIPIAGPDHFYTRVIDEVEKLLGKGASAAYVRMRLKDGTAFEPHAMCKVDPRRGSSTVCEHR